MDSWWIPPFCSAGISFLELVKIEASTSKLSDGMGDDLQGVGICVEVLRAVHVLLSRYGLPVEAATLECLLGLTCWRSNLNV